MNNVSLVGRLVRDPELRYIPGAGTPVATFSIAVDRDFTNKEGQREADFINIQVWNKAAENCANYLSKGSLVGIQGSIRVESYLKDDEKRTATKIRANSVKFLSSNKKKDNTAPAGFTQVDDDADFLADEDVPF